MVAVNYDQEKMVKICRRWKVAELSVFGSAVRGDFRKDSDVDLLVSFHEGAEVSLFDFVGLRDDFLEFFGRDVELISRKSLEETRNPIRKKSILAATESIYES